MTVRLSIFIDRAHQRLGFRKKDILIKLLIEILCLIKIFLLNFSHYFITDGNTLSEYHQDRTRVDFKGINKIYCFPQGALLFLFKFILPIKKI